MGWDSRRSMYTLVEVLVAALVLGGLVALLVPAIQQARERSRRTACLENLKQLGLALQNMESAQKRFPPSCYVKKDSAGRIIALDGWSWCASLLPYMETSVSYVTVNVENTKPLDGEPVHVEFLATPFVDFHCPSFGGSPYVNETTKTEAITNYKAMGATHLESLNVASPRPTVPRYAPDDPGRHPDGAIFPGSTHGLPAFTEDGTSRT